MYKITLFGDMMCEPLLLRQARQKDGQFNFDGMFVQIRPMIDEADYVICNLETPLAGEAAGYTDSLFQFNTPDSFADAIKKAGISMVTTANNHCLDRGFKGLKRTVQVLDAKGIPHFGTWEKPEDRQEAFYFSLGEQTIALIAGTYGTNYAVNHCNLNEAEEQCILLFHAHNEPVYRKKNIVKTKSVPRKVWNKFLKMFSEEKRTWILRTLGMPYNYTREDDFLDPLTAKPYFDNLRENIRLAKQKADLVIFYPHVGGQFNINPGPFTRYTFEQALDAGCDAVIASHPHIVQKAEIKAGIPCFYSIGNFSMSPNSVYLLPEHLPEYGLAVHLYIDEKKIQQLSFSILKMVETKKDMLVVWPVDQYYAQCDAQQKQDVEKHVKQIYQTVSSRRLETEPIRREYILSD